MAELVVVVAIYETERSGKLIDHNGELLAQAQAVLGHLEGNLCGASVGDVYKILLATLYGKLMVVGRFVLRHILGKLFGKSKALGLDIIDEVLLGVDAGYTIARSSEFAPGGIIITQTLQGVGKRRQGCLGVLSQRDGIIEAVACITGEEVALERKLRELSFGLLGCGDSKAHLVAIPYLNPAVYTYTILVVAGLLQGGVRIDDTVVIPAATDAYGHIVRLTLVIGIDVECTFGSGCVLKCERFAASYLDGIVAAVPRGNLGSFVLLRKGSRGDAHEEHHQRVKNLSHCVCLLILMNKLIPNFSQPQMTKVAQK